MNGEEKFEGKEFYLSTRDEKGMYVIYSSESYAFTELEIITLIKLLVKERRGVITGRKILEIYRDATEHRKNITDERLKKIGIEDEDKSKTNLKTKQLKTK